MRTLSADADWGNVRHGKSVRFPALRRILEEQVDWTNIHRVIDIGSSRGDFVMWLHEINPRIETWAIEPDASVVDRYRNLPGLMFHSCRLESLTVPHDYFDLAFCSHTLEHATSARAMLKQIEISLRPGGLLLLEVPNIEAIAGNDVVEEFFIDKHSFHFDRQTLVDYASQSGFEVVSGANDKNALNISLLLRRKGPSTSYFPRGGKRRATRDQQWIESYEQKLDANRLLLRRVVNEKLRPLGKRQKVAYWGAGRILDALVKYGGLGPDDVFCLVDRHLYGIVAETHGLPIGKPEQLRLREPNTVVILGRSNEDEMARMAYAFGIRNIVKFSELMSQIQGSILASDQEVKA